jgi:hypothetical protein
MKKGVVIEFIKSLPTYGEGKYKDWLSDFTVSFKLRETDDSQGRIRQFCCKRKVNHTEMRSKKNVRSSVQRQFDF